MEDQQTIAAEAGEEVTRTETETEKEEAVEESREAVPMPQNPVPDEVETLRAQLAEANSRLEQLQRERCLLDRGVPADDVDYYAFKIAQGLAPDADFDKAAEQYLKEHGIRGAANGPRFSSGAALGAQSPRREAPGDRMNELIRAARG